MISLSMRLQNREYHDILTGSSTKPKPKRRPVEQPEAPLELVPEPALNDEENVSEIIMTGRAFDVFTLMYPITAEESAKSVE